MKAYTEMTRAEIGNIVKRGGDDLRKLNQAVADHLDTLELSERARAVIANTDMNCMAECFGGLMTAEAVEQDIAENYDEE